MRPIIALLSLIGFLMVVLPGPLYQFFGLDLGLAFATIRYGVYVGGAALILIILQVIVARKTVQWGSTLLYTVLSLVAIIMPLSMMGKASAVPPIHDITTDVTNPPKFVAIAPLREAAPNDINYAGGEITQQQLEAYPQIKTQLFAKPVGEVYQAAKNVVEDLGWELVEADASSNTIEATDTTLWFGFKDDVVIRLTAKQDDTLVDVRSKSRVGKSDLGKNAERIDIFFTELRKATDIAN